MGRYLSEELRTRVQQADHRRCAYCLSSEVNTGIPLTIDHIHPTSRGGETAFDNLCLACRPCNEFKSDAVGVEDPLTGEVVALFHPRRQRWRDHFAWSGDGILIEGQTAVGRATVVALRMNRAAIVAARSRWCI